MENSLGSSVNNPLAPSKEAVDHFSSEESGWTSYFEDFSNNIEEGYSHSSFGTSSSWVSDAASCAAWNNNHIIACSSPKTPEKFSFKKTRTREISYDDSLEDTASSPVSSPKVADLKQMGSSFQGKGGISVHISQMQKHETSGINVNGRVKNDCTDLRKRGLCLVPFSMLVNYLG